MNQFIWPLKRLQIELVNVCNYRCPLCRTLNDDVVRRQMTIKEFERIINSVADELELVSLYGTRGEPLIHRGLEEAVQLVRSKTGAAVIISTNGSLVTKQRSQGLLAAGLSEIIFAVDGLTQSSYEKYRVGGQLDNVVQNIKDFCELKNAGAFKTRVVFQFIPMASNEHEVAQVGEFGYELGVDEVRLKLSSSVTSSKSYKTSSSDYHPPSEKGDFFACPSGLDKLYIDPNGDCFPCCYMEGYQRLCVGNALEIDLKKIWNSPKLWELRRSFAEQSGFNQFCSINCCNVARRSRVSIPKSAALAK